MKQVLKSYHVFLPVMWERAVVYLFYPALLILINYWVRVALGVNAETCLILCAGMLVTAELFLDYFFFGGIAAKDTNKLEYFKTSSKGLSILKKSLLVDWIRRLISVGIILMSVCGFSGGLLPFGKTVVCVFSTLFLIELGLVVNRFFSLMGAVIAVTVFLGMFSMVLTMSALENEIMVWLCPVLCVGASVLGRMMIICKMKGSYYDGRD